MAATRAKGKKSKTAEVKTEVMTESPAREATGLPKWHQAEAGMDEGEKLDPKEEKMLDWILNGVVIFILGWLGLSVLLVIGGYFGLWK